MAQIEQIDEDSDEEDEHCEVEPEALADVKDKHMGISEFHKQFGTLSKYPSETVHEDQADEKSHIRMTAYAASSGQKVKLTDLDGNKNRNSSKSAVVGDVGSKKFQKSEDDMPKFALSTFGVSETKQEEGKSNIDAHEPTEPLSRCITALDNDRKRFFPPRTDRDSSAFL